MIKIIIFAYLVLCAIGVVASIYQELKYYLKQLKKYGRNKHNH